jgi:protein-L-isoaspartate(D-aspartate) O-methyltransferase
MVAIMCETLNIKKGQKILEIGAGSGYHAAIVSYIVGENGCVYSIERIPSLAKLAKRNIELSGIKNITIKTGDGSNGLPEYAPYDRIYVTCAAPEVPPPLLEQLQDGGILLIPVGQFYSRLKSIKKEGDKFRSSDLGGCAFVPLLGKYGF